MRASRYLSRARILFLRSPKRGRLQVGQMSSSSEWLYTLQAVIDYADNLNRENFSSNLERGSQMKIGYNKAIGTMFILLGLCTCCSAATFTRIGNGEIPVGLAGVFWISLLLGFLFLRSTYLELTQGSLVVRAWFGFTTKTYKFNSPQDFTVHGRKILLDIQDNPQPLAISTWAADRHGWEALLKWIQDSNTAAPQK